MGVPGPERTWLPYGLRIWVLFVVVLVLRYAVPQVTWEKNPDLSLARLGMQLARFGKDFFLALAPVAGGTLFFSAWLPHTGRWRVPGLALGSLASSLGASLLLLAIRPSSPTPVADVLDYWLDFSLPVALFTAIHEAHHRAMRAVHRTRMLRVQDARLEAELSRARLQLLEAQIEPHFLFNTLAHVELLYRTDPGAGARMLDALIAYLRTSLPSLRRSQVLLGEEAALLAAYLEIHRIRLGARLGYELSIPAELGAAEVPSMMLLTLVENAVKHGINPLPRGGRVVVHAAKRGDVLEICVDDSGRGLRTGRGSGFGLANLKGRLAARFGGDARFDLRCDPALGTRARLALPLSFASAGEQRS